MKIKTSIGSFSLILLMTLTSPMQSLLAEVAGSRGSTSPPVSDLVDRPFERRVFEITAICPDLSYPEIVRIMRESDGIEQKLSRQVRETDIGNAIRDRLNRAEVSLEEAKDFYSANRGVFGDRGFDTSRATVEMLIKVQRVRRQYGVE